MFGFIGEWLGIITGVVCAASIICALTPTPKTMPWLESYTKYLNYVH